MATVTTTIGTRQEGVGHASDYTFSDIKYSVPSWLAKLLGYGGEGVARYIELKPSLRPDWNRLVSLSWRVVRSRSAVSLVPDSVFVRFIEYEVAGKFRFNRWLEVVAAPRAGKSAGDIRGIIRWIIENDLPNYTALVVAPNRRLAETLYRYAIGAAARLYRELRRNGVKISRGDFYSKIRIRLYLGSEMSCLAGRKEHYIESCIKSCPLFKLYEKKWRKVPPIPVLDPWLLRLSGYCPFIAGFSKSFWYKSVVVITYDSLWYALRNIERYGIRNVILILDEYLVHLYKGRGVLKKIDIDRVRNLVGNDNFNKEVEVMIDLAGGKKAIVSLARGLKVWNNNVDYIERKVVRRYNEIIFGKKGMEERSLRGPRLANMIIEYMLKLGINVYKDVHRYLKELLYVAEAVIKIANDIDDIDKRMKIRRLGLWMLKNVLGFASVLENNDKKIRYVFVKWVMGKNSEYIVSTPGSMIRGVISYLILDKFKKKEEDESGSKKENKNEENNRKITVDRLIGVISSSVDDSFINGFSLAPHESLDHVIVRVDRILKSVEGGRIGWSPSMFYMNKRKMKKRNGSNYQIVKSMHELFKLLRDTIGIHGNCVIVMNKMMIDYVSDIFERNFSVKVKKYGDLDRGIVDYAIVEKENGMILLVSPHSRVAMGIDPPIQDPRLIIVLFGLRRPVREYIKLDLNVLLGLYYRDELGIADFRIVRDDSGVYYVADSDGKHTRIWLYDVFDYKYDKHLLLQVIGRWYMQSVGIILYNAKYSLTDVRYYAINYSILFDIPKYPFYVEVKSIIKKWKGVENS